MFSIHRMHVGPSDMAAVDVQAPWWVTAQKLAMGSIRPMQFAASAPAGSAPLTASRRTGCLRRMPPGDDRRCCHGQWPGAVPPRPSAPVRRAAVRSANHSQA